jgi:hypothetical protein
MAVSAAAHSLDQPAASAMRERQSAETQRLGLGEGALDARARGVVRAELAVGQRADALGRDRSREIER